MTRNKLSLKEQILKRFREHYLNGFNGFVNGGEIEKFAISLGYKGSTAGRELRLMSDGISEKPSLEKEERKGPHSRVA